MAIKPMSTYPYFSKGHHFSYLLKTFPLAFGSQIDLPYSYKEIHQLDRKYDFIVNSHKLLIDSIASNDLSKLEGMVEYNLLKKLEQSLSKLEALDIKLFVIGSLHNTKVYYCQKEVYSGSILPYRNLFLPDEEYQIYSSRFFKANFTTINVSVTNLMPVKFKFHELESFDFEAANKNPPHDAQEHIMDFHQITNIMKLEAENQEFIVNSKYKIIAVDSNKNVISGNENDNFEAHTGIFEKFRFFGFNYKLFTNRLKKAESLYERALNGYLNNSRLVDLDGCMERNPPLPKHLLN